MQQVLLQPVTAGHFTPHHERGSALASEPAGPRHLPTTGAELGESHSRRGEPPDSCFSAPPAAVLGGTGCSDKVAHHEKAHTAEDISLLPLPGAPSTVAVHSSFSFLPTQKKKKSPKRFCFLRDVEYVNQERGEIPQNVKSHILKASHRHTGARRGVREGRATANREPALKPSRAAVWLQQC